MKINILEKIYSRKIKNNKNKSVVELCINNEMDLCNKYSICDKNDIKNNNVRINNEIIDYLINEIKVVPHKNTFVINIKIFDKMDFEINFIKKLIKDSIDRKMLIINKKIKRVNIYSFILAWVGMMLIGITQIFQFIEKRYSLNQFIIVMSWVFMWKAVDLIFFERAEIIKEKGILLKIYYSDVTII